MHRRVVANGVLLIAAWLCLPVTATFASNTQRVRNSEYNFSVVFPGGVVVCTATSGDQPHGFFVRLNSSQNDCHNAEKEAGGSVISVIAYSNATFENSPEEEIASLCRRGVAGEGTNAMQGLGFVGRHSASCRVEQANGSMDVYVVTQAGQWPGAHESPELNSPYVNYTASLHTTKERMPVDLQVFRRVLSNIHIGYKK